MLLYSSELVFSIIKAKVDSLPSAGPVPSGPARSGCAAQNSFSREENSAQKQKQCSKAKAIPLGS